MRAYPISIRYIRSNKCKEISWQVSSWWPSSGVQTVIHVGVSSNEMIVAIKLSVMSQFRARKRFSWMILCSLAVSVPARGNPGACQPADRSPEVVQIRSEPGGSGKVLESVSKGALSAVRLDAITLPGGVDWINVRKGTTSGWVNAKDLVCRLPKEEARAAVSSVAEEVIRDLKDRNMDALAQYVHPIKGVRFSPYASVDRASDVVLRVPALKQAFASPVRRTWGSYDGSGAPIRLSFAGYYSKFVYERDFALTAHRNYNTFAGESTTANNIWEEYPNSAVV